MEKSFCTTREAADMLGVSVGTVQLWVESGLLRAWKTTGGHRRVLRESIDALLHHGARSSPKVAPPELSQGSFRILVVEDDAALQRLYQANLQRWDMAPDVTVVDNAVSALMHIGHASPDLLISDLHMPGVDGFYMLRVLEKSPQVADTTIVVVTGLDAPDIARRGGVPEGVETFPKPVPFAKLHALALTVQQRKITQNNARKEGDRGPYSYS